MDTPELGTSSPLTKKDTCPEMSTVIATLVKDSELNAGRGKVNATSPLWPNVTAFLEIWM